MQKHTRAHAHAPDRNGCRHHCVQDGEAQLSARLHLHVESPAKVPPMTSPPTRKEQVQRAACCTVEKLSDVDFKEGRKREGSRSQS